MRISRTKKAVVALAVTMLMSGAGVAYATSRSQSESNDHILVGTHQDYQEFFKRDSGSSNPHSGDTKNYLYTSSAVVDAPPPGKCVVVTGNSEQTIAISCNYASR